MLEHLKGEKQDCSDVIGLYPAHSNETCYFLVFDFDNHMDNQAIESKISDKALFEEVSALCEICKQNSISYLYKNKNDVIIYDYIDINIPVLERMSHKRFNTYKKIGYELLNENQHEKQNSLINDSDEQIQSQRKNYFFDCTDFLQFFKSDILQAETEIIICSPLINAKQASHFINQFLLPQIET